jgi:DNA transposition AAA+ family ATPase
MSPQGGSFPYSAWMKEGVETRTERVKRLERNRVLNQIHVRLDEEYHRIIDDNDLRLFRRILSELREGEE